MAIDQQRMLTRINLPNYEGTESRTFVMAYADRMQQSKLSPRKFPPNNQQWEFDFVSAGYAIINPAQGGKRRFNVYSQEHKREGDRAPMVATMLLRLWEHNNDLYGIDNPPNYRDGTIDVYLSWGGTPGGEQMFGVDPQILDTNRAPSPVDTIYIYDLNSFTDPVEMAREVAHEYGHASLPAVGGFKTPEDWANGFLGEKLFLVRLRDRMREHKATPADAMGATEPLLSAWITKNVDPLVRRGLLYGPTLLEKPSAPMDDYLALMLAQSAILPSKAFGRAMRLVGSTDAKDVPQSFVMASAEVPTFEFAVPATATGLPIWFPSTTAKFTGAKVLRKQNGWTKLQPTASKISVSTN